MTHRFVACVLTAIFLVACSDVEEVSTQQPSQSRADLVLINGKVYTFSWDEPDVSGELAGNAPYDKGWRHDAEAVVLKDGLIHYVGTTDEAMAYVGEDTQAVDLNGATLLPGLTDSHTHVFNLGQALSRVDLFDVETEEEAVARIANYAKNVPKGKWIVGQGWDEGAWANRYPNKTLLTEAVPDHPVFMRSLHSFAGWVNQMALDRVGITADTVIPRGGEIYLGADGEPNGLFLNRAVPLIESALSPLTQEQMTEQVLLAMNQMVKDGYVMVHDAGINEDELKVLQALDKANRLPIRVYAMLSVRDEGLVREWLVKGPGAEDTDRLMVRSIKAYYDGALGSRGARLLSDYADRPGHKGVSGGEYGFNQDLVAELMNVGFQVGIHAIGDAGNRETLDFIERVIKKNPEVAKGRHRIEHAQVVHPLDFPRFGELSVTASMEPPHAVEDKTWAEARLGPERIKGAYAWRTLRKSGAKLIFNADNPGSDHNIFYGLHAAVTRRDKNLEPYDGWYSSESVTMDEAIRAYTSWPAYSAFVEEKTGKIETGRWADLTAISLDPLRTAENDPDGLLKGKVVLTVVAGRIVYRDLPN